MSKDAMRTVLFWLFIGVIGVTVLLTMYATYTAIQKPDSERLWDFVYYTWGGVLLEVVAFVIALAKNLFGQRSDDLAREIAAKWAQEIVTHSSGDATALNTIYWDTREDFPVHFRSQGKDWLCVLYEEFAEETKRESRRFASLKGWKPSTEPPDLSPVDLGSESNARPEIIPKPNEVIVDGIRVPVRKNKDRGSRKPENSDPK